MLVKDLICLGKDSTEIFFIFFKKKSLNTENKACLNTPAVQFG